MPDNQKPKKENSNAQAATEAEYAAVVVSIQSQDIKITDEMQETADRIRTGK